MEMPRSSVAGMLVAVGFVAAGLTCLLHASSPLTSAVLSAALCILALAPIGVAYRRGERRAFWLGVTLVGWSYALLAFGPGFSESFRPHLVSTRVLKWAHPLVIGEARQVPQDRPWRTFGIDSPAHGVEIEAETVHQAPLDVLAQGAGEGLPSPLVEDLEVVGSGGSGASISQVTLKVYPEQLAKLQQAKAGGARFVIRRHLTPVAGPLAGLWSSPPVRVDDFVRVGHVLCGIVCAAFGGWASRYAYLTNGPDPLAGSDDV